MRGGFWNDIPRLLRASDRTFYYPNYRFNYIGFRLRKIAQ
jgi:formylglycine-generating enzyme required for sulfatase activity